MTPDPGGSPYRACNRRFAATASAIALGRQFGGEKIERTGHRRRPLAGHMGIDHRGFEALVAEKHLNGAQVNAALDQMGRERMTQRVTPSTARRSRAPNGVGDRRTGIDMVPANVPCLGRARVAATRTETASRVWRAPRNPPDFDRGIA